MDSPIRPEDLLSDVEPLPVSVPNSAPASPRPRPGSDRSAGARSLPASPYATLTSSSEVTARLYASLQTSRELGADRSSAPDLRPFGQHLACQAGEGGTEFPAGGRPVKASSGSGSPSSRRAAFRPSTSDPKEVAELAPPTGFQSARGDRSSEGIRRPRSRLESPVQPPGPDAAALKMAASSWSLARPALERNTADPEIAATHRPKEARSAGQVAAPDLEELAVEMTQRLSKRVEASGRGKVGSRHISEMESVRSHLQNMLKLSQDLTYRDAAVSPISPTLVPNGAEQKRDEDSFESDCTSSLLSAQPFQEISVSPPVPILGLDEAALFPRYSRMRLGTGAGPVNESSLYEYQILKDTLDKERTRRKHCEKQIQTLQNKILELQQQLAVAVSADRKKDIMIEQLDKTLVKVVEGWKKHDTEKSEAMRKLQEEHEAAEKGRSKQQQALLKVEHRLSQANQTLAKEQQEKALLERERGLLEEESQKLQMVLEAEKQRCLKLQGERDKAESARLHERKQAETLRAKLGEEREACSQREKQLEERNAQREEELQRQLEKEKAIAQREAQRGQDAQQVLSSVQTELQRLEIELDTVKRDKENLMMELSLMKARCESQRVKSETEFKVTLEQQVTERLTAVHEDSARQTAAIREQHRKQIMELTGQHEHEMGKQLAEFKTELQEREEKHRRIIEGYEIRLAKGQEEKGKLLSMKRKLEVQRGEMVTKLQTMMQSHWNEALKVLMSENSPLGHQQQQQPVLHYDQVPVYRELSKSLSTSGTPAVSSSMTTSSDLSSSSIVPYADPASETEQLKHPSDSRGPWAPGNQPHRNLVKLHHSEQQGWVSQRTDHRLHELARDRQVSGDGIECGQLPFKAQENVNISVRNSRNLHGSFPQAIPLQPMVQSSSQGLAPVASKDQEVNPHSNVSSRHSTLCRNSTETLNPRLKREHHLHHADKCAPRWDQPQPAGHSSAAGQSHNQSLMLPLLPNSHSLDDLSQLLNYSFLSHASFYPLEPQVDETMMTAPGPYPDELAEHPLTDDAEDSGHTQYQPSIEGGPTQDSSFESSGGLSYQEQSSRSGELQYYIQMLLDRSPGDPVETNAGAANPHEAASQQGGSPVLRDRSNLGENTKPRPMGQLSTAPNGKPLSSAVQKVKINPSEAAPLQRAFGPQSPQKPGVAGGVLSPKQIGELSRLLSTYHNISDRPAPAMEELFTYLRDIQQNGPEGSESMAASARRSLDQKLNQMAKDEGLSAQPSAQRRLSASKTGAEKSSNSGKPGKKHALASQPGSKGAKSAIWR